MNSSTELNLPKERSTKDAIYTTLKNSLNIRKNEKSLNGDIGTPLTVLGCDGGWSNPLRWLVIFIHGFIIILFKKDYPQWLILEVGMDKPKEMQAIAKWLKSDVVVITALPTTPVHVENFNSPEDVIQEKLSIPRALKSNGVLVLNGDDKKVREVSQEFSQRKIFYGTNETNDIRTSNKEGKIIYTNETPIGMQYKISVKNGEETIFLRDILGEQWIYLILATVAVCEAISLDKYNIAQSFINYEAPPGRMRIIEGIKNTTIIDDSYNSSPIAISVALQALDKLKVKGRKIAVLGDMRELGEFSEREHITAGKQASKVVDILITIGEESEALAKSAEKTGLKKENIFKFGYYNSAKAGEYINSILQEGDVILVKGSQNKIRAEHTVKAIMAHPERASELLVRQEKEWLTKK